MGQICIRSNCACEAYLQFHKHFALLVDNSRWTWTREHSTYCHFLPYEAKSDTERVLNYKTYFKAERDEMKKAATENCYSMREKKGTKDFKCNLKQRFKPTSNIRFAEYRSSVLCYYTLWCDNRKILELCLAIKVIHERVNHAKIVVYTTCCQLTH